MNRDLIDRLVQDLQPVQPRGLAGPVLVWLAVTWGALLAWMWSTGGPRPGLAGQLSEVRFAAEVGVGLAASLSALVVGLGLAIPGRFSQRTRWAAPLALVLWVGLLGWAWFSPALEPSMVGKRPHCEVETLLLALVPFAGALWAAARLAPLSRAAIGAMLGFASASVPALLMQLFCMADPAHALTHHLAPALVMGVAGALVGRSVLPRV